MTKQEFIREVVYKSDKEGSRTISFVVNVYQDKDDKEKIWVVSKEILNPTEINNHENSVNYHPKMFERLKNILIQEGRWTE
ncbi:hypothetical protein QUF65_14190 [Lysinibacillus sphaericus]|uniref:hypothetical protein n=1 Tax=Lysinibacillus sphaericus TaxID=1421 RepID=UPI0025A23C52|nr:hypothetical protein [Lysinibacillus sphaericus]MDM5352033.1 hypothetical protein [Lysinibacillus sphaericus]